MGVNYTVVIVTYSNRFFYLEKVLDECFRQGAKDIVVVNNCLEDESYNKLLHYKEGFLGDLKILSMDRNMGSAFGFKAGMEYAIKCGAQFIALLDDDNVPGENYFCKIKKYWGEFNFEEKNKRVAFLSYRSDRKVYMEAASSGRPDVILGKPNGFLGFHFFSLPGKFIKRFYGDKCKGVKRDIQGKVPVAPYGGMFFHVDLIKTIGYPDSRYFVYADDYDWSYRIPFIRYISDCEVLDIEQSWNVSSGSLSPFYRYLNEGSDFRVYYSVRNRIHFEKILIKNKVVYFFNFFLFFLFIIFYIRPKNFNRFKIFNKAVIDGFKGILGEASNERL